MIKGRIEFHKDNCPESPYSSDFFRAWLEIDGEMCYADSEDPDFLRRMMKSQYGVTHYYNSCVGLGALFPIDQVFIREGE